MTAFLRYNKEVQAIVGMKVKGAEKHLKKYNEEVQLRVVINDGEYTAVTRDYIGTRINVSVIDGVITSIISQG